MSECQDVKTSKCRNDNVSENNPVSEKWCLKTAKTKAGLCLPEKGKGSARPKNRRRAQPAPKKGRALPAQLKQVLYLGIVQFPAVPLVWTKIPFGSHGGVVAPASLPK